MFFSKSIISIVQLNFILHIYIFCIFLCFFSTKNLYILFICFEAMIIPILIYLMFLGPKIEKKKASLYYVGFSFLGASFFFIGIFTIWNIFHTFNLEILKYTDISQSLENFLWLCFFIPFAIKFPIVPFHQWLPEAHVEASTEGSIILAAILLKFGGYSLIRINLSILPNATIYYFPLICCLGILSILYISFIFLRQVDLKKIIAYTSIIHMNLILIALASQIEEAFIGSVFTMLTHGLVSTALFFSVGCLYDRFLIRDLKHLGNFGNLFPTLNFFFFFFFLCNFSFPGTISFIGEFLICLGILKKNFFLFLITLFANIFGGIGLIYYYTKLFSGNSYLNLYHCYDLHHYEKILFYILFFPCLFGGLKPFFLLNTICCV